MITEHTLKKAYPKLKNKWKKVDDRGNYQKPNPRLYNGVRRINKLKGYSKINVLDIGCNNGVLSAVASHHFNKVIGIDIAAEKDVIKKAKVTAKFFGRSNCKFHKTTFFDYYDTCKFEEDKIKAIMGFQVLYHLNDMEISMLRVACHELEMAIISVRPEVGDRIEPGKPANKLGLYTVEQAVEFFFPYFRKIRVRNKDTRWPTLTMIK